MLSPQLKYPHLVVGAVSSSAPLHIKLDFVEYLEVVQRSLLSTKHGIECVKRLRNGTSIPYYQTPNLIFNHSWCILQITSLLGLFCLTKSMFFLMLWCAQQPLKLSLNCKVTMAGWRLRNIFDYVTPWGGDFFSGGQKNDHFSLNEIWISGLKIAIRSPRTSVSWWEML